MGSAFSACTIKRPCASAMAVEWSWRSLMLVENALRIIVKKHSSAIDFSPFQLISSEIGSSEFCSDIVQFQ